MSSTNVCHGCIGENDNECCVDVYIILNPEETHLFKEYKDRYKEVKDGGIFYTDQGCPYFEDNCCLIHQNNKPLYCIFYPIFITGKPFVHKECPKYKKFRLTEAVKKEILELQRIHPIYKKDWFWEDVQKELKIKS